MALNIKNPEVDRLATEVAAIAGETKTEAIRKALDERRLRLVAERASEDRTRRVRRFLEREVWAIVPA